MADKHEHITDEKERIALIRRQQKLSFMKFFLGTFLLGTLSTYVSYKLHDNEIKLQKLEYQDNQIANYLGQFMEGGNKEQLSFANFMRFNAVGSEEQTQYGKLFFYLKNQSDSLAVEAVKNQEEALEVETSFNEAVQERERLQKAYNTGEGNRDTIKMKLDLARKEATKTNLRLTKLNQVEEAIAIKISNPVKSMELEPVIIEDVIEPVDSAGFLRKGWSVNGHFKQYGQIRVVVYDPLKKKQKATLKVYYIGKDNSRTLLGSKQLSAGETMNMEHDTEEHNYKLMLTLNKVSKFYKVRNKAEWTLAQKRTAK